MKILFAMGFLFLMGAVSSAQEVTSSTSASAYANNMKMREERKVGVGAQAGGTAGTLGPVLELNLEDENGALFGFGFGEGYSTFSLAWKHSFEGEYFTPYSSLGWSRWYNSAGLKKPGSHVLDGMLTSDEIRESRFGLDLIVAGAGMQFNQLEGEFAGASFFTEIDLLVSPFRGKVLPTAGLGAVYYF